MSPLRFTRRDFLKLGAAAAALATGACSRPRETIVPYAHQPEAELPGVPRFYATAASFVGAAEGLLVEANTGRPTKVEGNPAHPGSLGGTSIHGQASVLELWDPERSKAPRQRGQPATRAQFELDLAAALARMRRTRGEGLRLLIGATDSPTLLRQLEAVSKQFPRARVHRWDPLHRDQSRAGAELAFGRPLEPIYRLEDAGAILSLDARFLDDHPYRLHYARQFARTRTPREGRMCRLYAFESTPSLVGAMADHRYAMPVAQIEEWLLKKAGAYPAIWRDLRQNRGVVLAGDALSPAAHALVHRLNQDLHAPVAYVEPIEPSAAPIGELVQAMQNGAVQLLLILGGNPAYDAPADLQFAAALSRVPLSVHLSLYDDETSALCTWHLAATHFMEHWSDSRALDGTASIVQPLIAPLYDAVSPHELLSLVLGEGRSGYDIVRATWREIDWEAALRSGVIAGSAFKPVSGSGLELAHRDAPIQDLTPAGWSVRFVADESVLDGRLANNAWLQELPRSHSKLTWDNAALVSPASAEDVGVATGDLVDISLGGRTLRAPVWVMPGHADASVTLPLGYGRTRAGAVGNRVGFDATALRTFQSPWSAGGAQVVKAGGRHRFASTQDHARMEGHDPARTVALADMAHFARDTPQHSLYPPWPYEGYRWAMSINLGSCIGCNACTIACQAENNIPAVGKEEVGRGRWMHWIRVDRYLEEERTLFQPVPCMHCENAPCEYVCPVEASVHDSEGLNVQVYNRCVGTRFCSQNCPYKVRRFNFFDYTTHEPTLVAQKNPEVTVRMRGVMEKCTYCVQRITRARIEAEKEGRRIRDGEVITACQAACPTGAIVFGDLSDEKSAVSRAKRSPLDYALLAELNTRPRTSYQARVINRNPEIEDG
jgi:Fe-S-cluster-containing dehydrogenase component